MLAEDLYPERLPGDEPEELEVVPWKLDALHELVLREDCSEGRSLAGAVHRARSAGGAAMSARAGAGRALRRAAAGAGARGRRRDHARVRAATSPSSTRTTARR